MKKKFANFRTPILFIFITLINVCFADDDSCLKLHSPKTDVSGVFRFQYTPVTCDSGYSILGELGGDNYRGSLTYVKQFWQCFRYKITGEYLTQRHTYEFSNSSKNQWIHQIAVGGAAQCVINWCGISSFDIGGDYSYAFSKHLSKVLCDNSSLKREISGSNAYNLRGGATVCSYNNGLLSLWLDYDAVRYQRENQHKKNVIGYGGGFWLDQPVSDCFVINILGDIKKPYQYYELQVNYESHSDGGDWRVGTFTSYTHGRFGLCNDVKIGGQISFGYGAAAPKRRSRRCEVICCRNSLKSWAAIPAVYRPVVLAIPDQQLCAAPEPIGTVPEVIVLESGTPMSPIDFSQYFSGTCLIYTLTNLPAGLNFDTTSGILSGTPEGNGQYQVTLIASNGCGSVTYEITMNLQSPG